MLIWRFLRLKTQECVSSASLIRLTGGKQYYAVLEKTQKGDCDITEWIIWYLDCLLRSVGQSDESLSKVLDKAVFWQNHAETVLSGRQREVESGSAMSFTESVAVSLSLPSRCLRIYNFALPPIIPYLCHASPPERTAGRVDL